MVTLLDIYYQLLYFIEAKPAYVINYNLGQDLVVKDIDKMVNTGNDAFRWNIFTKLLAKPRAISMMK
jgi:hypothetical protein